MKSKEWVVFIKIFLGFPIVYAASRRYASLKKGTKNGPKTLSP